MKLRSFICVTAILLATSIGMAADAQRHSGKEAYALRHDGILRGRTVVAETCSYSERCFDSSGKWNGRCPCDACARGKGWC
jgi:hypothetical protein